MASYIQVKGYGLEQGFKGIKKTASAKKDTWNLDFEVGSYPNTPVSETATHHYTFTRSGRVEGKHPKKSPELYADWIQDNVNFLVTTTRSGIIEGVRRETELSEYEKDMGMTKGETLSIVGKTAFSGKRGYTKISFNAEMLKKIQSYVYQKETERAERIQAEQEAKLRAEEERLRLLALSRPNPKEETIASVKVEEIKPTSISYLPLGIVAVVVIGVVLLLRRRA